jgi:two-component system chemotaxis response regulator CheY
MRILIVDDDYVARVKLSTLLSSYGDCDKAPNGEVAVKLFEAAYKELAPYDLVTMDIEMSGMSGHQVVQSMRGIEQYLHRAVEKESKILVVTAKDYSEEMVSSYCDGCNGYLTKPVTSENIKNFMETLGYKRHASGSFPKEDSK